MSTTSYNSLFQNVLKAGQSFLSGIDPEGCFASVKVSQFHYTSFNEVDCWSLMFSFASGENMHVSGSYSAATGVLVKQCVFIVRNEKFVLPVIPSDSLFKALGDIASIPESLKNVLQNLTPQNYNSDLLESFDWHLFYCQLIQSFFSGFEFEDSETGVSYFDRFNDFRIKYTGGLNEQKSVRVQSFCMIDDMKVLLSSTMTMFGFSAMSVRVDFVLGGKSVYSCDCFSNIDGRKIPSVVSAVRLIDLFSKTVKQRRKKTGMGRPRSKK